MKHEIIWEAVDNLAKKNGLSPSGMAKKAGLDPTIFNKSKRILKDGRKRWPSMQSINKLLSLFDISLEEFYGRRAGPQNLYSPIATYSKINLNLVLSNQGLDFSSWNKMDFNENSAETYSLELDTNRFEPIYKYGSIIIITTNSQIRRGDRVIIINRFKEINLYEFLSQKNDSIEVVNLNKMDNIEILKNDDVRLLHRILWASQ